MALEIKVKLTRVVSNKGEHTQATYTGITFRLPEIGSNFAVYYMVGEHLGDNRQLYTTDVQEVKQLSTQKYVFLTKNSVYELEVLDDTAPAV